MPGGMPLTLLGSSAAEVAAAQRDVARIGIDQVQAAAAGGPDAWSGGQPLARYPVADFAGYTRALGRREAILLDVRRRSEREGTRIAGAVHIPLHELPGRVAEVAEGEIWVHCQAGYRASVAAGLLDAAGREVVFLDDDLRAAEEGGLAP